MIILKYKLVTIFSFLVLLSATIVQAQNLEEISLKKGLKLNGSINLNTVGYTTVGIPKRRDPFNWFLTGGLNINLFGYSAPLSFSVSNVNRSFSQPFNQFSFAPQYKWVKTYIGYNSMTFSPYTLAGHVFLGGGVELSPGNWRIAAMYGRLRKAVPFSLSDSLQHTQASFKRMGYGVKVGYETNGNSISFNVFTAKDDPTSLPFVPSNSITPYQNVAMSLSGRKTLFRRFFVDMEYAVSALNTNIRANSEEVEDSTIKANNNLIKGLLPQNTTSRYFDAITTSLGYQGKGYAIQLKYERIAPEYQTLGAYYFNNDMRNITIMPTARLFKNKLTLGGNVGVQQNNLDRTRASTTLRTVGAINIQYLPDDKWSIATNYSNFSSYTNIRPQEDPFFQNNLDTLNFYQINQTMAGTIARRLGGKENPQNVMVSGSYQKGSNKAANTSGIQLSDFVSAIVSYSYSLTPSGLTLGIGANVNTNNAAGIKTTFFGPTINATKSLLGKALRCSYSSSYSQTLSNSLKTSPVWNNQINLSFSPKGKETTSRSSFSLGVNILRRFQQIGTQPAFTETTATLNYAYTF